MKLYDEEPDIDQLCVLGIDYIYDGAKNPFDNKSFNIDEIEKLSNVELIYEKEGVSIFKICD